MARKNTPEQEMESERIGLINSIQRWKHLKEFGGQDPFWTDGVNMNLVRNHVIYAKNKIYAISKKYKLPIPDEFYLQTPPEVDDLYMAQRRKWGEKMKIQIGERIYLNSDSQCYWITQEKEVKRGNNAGKFTEKRITGYFRNLTDLLSDIPERKIRECDAETVKELKDVVSRTESLVREIIDKLSRFNKELEIDEDTFPM